MRNLTLTESVKTDHPYLVVGDAGAVIQLSDEAAAYAVQQGWGTTEGTLQPYEEIVPPPQPVGTLQKMNFEQNVAPELPDEPVRHVKEQAPERDPAPDEPVLKKPDGRTSQKGWAAWAVANDPDLTTERAEGMSKQDLMSQYGGRW